MQASCILRRNLHPARLGHMIHTVAIVGGGLMGSGVAQIAAAAGNTVYVYDRQPKELEETRNRIEKSLDRTGVDLYEGESGKIAEYIRTAKTNLIYTADWKQAFSNTDIVLEAIFENQEAKTRLFAKLEARTTNPKTIFASNTVGISIAHIASQSHRKDKFIGCRFFFPVPKTILAEVTRTVETSDDTVKKVCDWVKTLKKFPVPLADAPGGGGIVHRLPYFQKAFATLARGGAPIDEVDSAMKHSLGLYQGPFRILDEIGLDVFVNVLDTLSKKYKDDPAYSVPPILRQLVEEGKLGVKTGEGFFSYKIDTDR